MPIPEIEDRDELGTVFVVIFQPPLEIDRLRMTDVRNLPEPCIRGFTDSATLPLQP